MEIREVLVAEALYRVSLTDNTREKARMIGVSEATVRRWQGGEVSPFRGDTRPALDRFLGLDGLPVDEAAEKIEAFREAAIQRAHADAERARLFQQRAADAREGAPGREPRKASGE